MLGGWRLLLWESGERRWDKPQKLEKKREEKDTHAKFACKLSAVFTASTAGFTGWEGNIETVWDITVVCDYTTSKSCQPCGACGTTGRMFMKKFLCLPRLCQLQKHERTEVTRLIEKGSSMVFCHFCLDLWLSFTFSTAARWRNGWDWVDSDLLHVASIYYTGKMFCRDIVLVAGLA